MYVNTQNVLKTKSSIHPFCPLFKEVTGRALKGYFRITIIGMTSAWHKGGMSIGKVSHPGVILVLGSGFLNKCLNSLEGYGCIIS